MAKRRGLNSRVTYGEADLLSKKRMFEKAAKTERAKLAAARERRDLMEEQLEDTIARSKLREDVARKLADPNKEPWDGARQKARDLAAIASGIGADPSGYQAPIGYTAPEINVVDLLKKIDGKRRKPHDWLDYRDRLQEIFLAEEETIVRLSGWPPSPEDKTRHIFRGLVQFLHLCEVVVWELDMWNTSRHRAEVWTGTPVDWDDLYLTPQFWTFDEVLVMDDASVKWFGLDRTCAIDAIIRLPSGITPELAALPDDQRPYVITEEQTSRINRESLGVCFILVFAPELPSHLRGSVAHGLLRGDIEAVCPRVRILPPIYNGEAIPAAYAELMAASMWMNLPFVGSRKLDLQRDRAKTYGKRKPSHSQVVRTIILRRRLNERDPNAPKGTVEWSCQWPVKGHWRARRKDEAPGAPRWINPYIKGPADRPLKAATSTIARVKR